MKKLNLKQNNPRSTSSDLRRSGGFSLIETLVATAIIVMAAVGPLALAGTSLGQANYIKDQIVATFLAQEGLEIMRNIRDSQGIGTIKSLYDGSYPGNVDCRFGNNSCTVSGTENDATTYIVTQCGTECLPLKYDPANYLYQYREGNNSIFTRSVSIVELSSVDEEYKIKSEVKWWRAGKSHTIRLTENLFDRRW